MHSDIACFRGWLFNSAPTAVNANEALRTSKQCHKAGRLLRHRLLVTRTERTLRCIQRILYAVKENTWALPHFRCSDAASSRYE